MAELVNSTNLKVKAHAIYELLIRKYPSQAPPGHKEDFPAKCWHCPMPESFYSKSCEPALKQLKNWPGGHFEERLLEGFGRMMAANEIVSHCEFLIRCGDIVGMNENQYGATGTANFEKYISATNPS